MESQINFYISGDTLIQNGSNGAIGRTVIQLANLKGVKTINIIRSRFVPNQILLLFFFPSSSVTFSSRIFSTSSPMLFIRPDFEHIVEQLKVQGGYIVVSDQYVRTPPFKRLISDLPPPKLGLNSAGGTSATEIARILGLV